MKLTTRFTLSAALLSLMLAASSVNAATFSIFYGDDDGFGIGQTSGNLANSETSNNTASDAPGTDERLIGTGFAAPGFEPTGNFEPFSLPGPVTSAVLTIRMGAFDSGPSPVDGPNRIFLDGLEVDSAFINSFSTANSTAIETLSIALDPSFFHIFNDGVVSLSGTRITEDSGSSSFQIDFLKLEVTAVPEPGTFMLFGLGIAGLMFARRRKLG